MDRLKDISRQGGYPWVAEEIEIIEKHADYINALLDGLRMPAKSCVFVQKNTNQSGKLAESIVYVVASDNGKGELFMLEADDDIMVADLLSGTAAKLHVDIDPDDVAVTGAQDVTWLACYTTKRVTLTDDAEDYTFYDLNDLLRPAVWKDLLPNLGTLAYESGSSWSSTTAQLYTETYENLLRTNGHTIEVRLDFRNSTISYTDARMRVDVNDSTGLAIPAGTIVPLQAMVLSNNSFSLYPCYIQRGSSTAIIHLPRVTIPANADLYITGVISLK